MITEDIAKLLIGYGKKSVESWTDRLAHKVFPIVLLFVVAAMFGQRVFGEPIHCAFPNDISDAATKYALVVCWAEGTYYVPEGKVVNPDEAKKEIKYYKWAPLFLILQAILSHAPVFMWRSLQKFFGYIKCNWSFSRSVGFICCYVFFKIVAISCMMVQIFFVTRFYGETPMFPDKTMCNFTLRQMSNFHQYTVQCVLGTDNAAIATIVYYVLVSLVILSSLDVCVFGLRLIRGPRSKGVIGMDKNKYGLFVLLKMNRYYQNVASTFKPLERMAIEMKTTDNFRSHYSRNDEVIIEEE